jgi:hypothetical protein
MVWVADINELEYYTNPDSAPGKYSPAFSCYGDKIFNPSDLILQAQLPQVTGNSYSLQILTYTCDGTTQIADVTSKFNYYVGLATTGICYANMLLSTNLTSADTNGSTCFILKVIFTDATGKVVWVNFTQRYDYDISNACVLASATSVTLNGINIAEDCSPDPSVDNCGNSYIKLYTYFNCGDQFTGDYYGLPTAVYLSSMSPVTPFTYYKVSWIKADKRYQPLTIKRTVSINCRLQKSEKQRNWLLRGNDLTGFPVWKAMEIEEMLYSDHIFVDGVEFTFNGGTAFKEVNKCISHYKMELLLQECYEYQLSGCSNICA